MTNEPSDSVYEMAEQAWNECWSDEPTMSMVADKSQLRAAYRGWLVDVFTDLVVGYDGPLSDIADHIGEFSDRFIEKRVRAILEDAREAEAQAQADAAADARADSREDW